MMAEKKKEKEAPKKEPEIPARELLKVIKKQQEQLSSTSEEIKKIKEAHNKMVDALSEIGEKLEKGAGGKGGLGEIATIIKAVAPLMRGRESSPFEAIGVYTFKQFLRSTMGKKMATKAIKDMAKGVEEGEEKEAEE